MGKRFRQLTQTATDADLVEGNYFGVDTLNVTKKVPANLLAKQSALETTNGNVTALTTYAQNVAHSIAPEFDPTRNYVVNDSCTYGGTAYVFTSNHPAGAWNPAHATISGQSALLLLTAQNAVRNVLSTTTYTEFENGKYFKSTSNTVGDVVTITQETQSPWECFNLEIVKGKRIQVKTYGGDTNRGIYVVSKATSKLLLATEGTGINELDYTAEEDCILYVNNVIAQLAEPFVEIVGVNGLVADLEEETEKKFQKIDEELNGNTYTEFENGKYFKSTSNTVGDVVTITQKTQSPWECFNLEIVKGKRIQVKTYGGDTNRGIYVVSKATSKLLLATEGTGINELDYTAEEDCILYVNNVIAQLAEPFVEIVGVNDRLDAIEAVGNIDCDIITPTKIYTICNDIGISSEIDTAENSRQHSVSVSLDNILYNAEKKQNVSIDGMHKIVFDSVLNSPGISNYNPQINSDTLWGNSDLYEKNLSVKFGNNGFNVKHLSVKNTATENFKPRILCLGDSVTAGFYGNVNKPYAKSPEAYFEWIKAFFEMDKLQNANSGFDCVLLGSLLRSSSQGDKTKKTFDINFNGLTESDVTACACGWGGATTNTWMGSNSPFYNPSTNKFSLEYYVENYRTLIVNNDGSVTRCDASNKGALAPSDTTKYDVCEPTHVVIQLGYNQAYDSDGETRSNYLADINEMITTIKTEYPDVIVILSLPDNGGTFYPEDYPQYCGDLGMPNPYDVLLWKGACKSWHDKFAFMNTDLMNLEDTANGIYYAPTYFTSIGLEQVPFRASSNPASLVLKDQQLEHRTIIGWSPHQHPNNAGHAAIGYELYSLIKYTMYEQSQANDS